MNGRKLKRVFTTREEPTKIASLATVPSSIEPSARTLKSLLTTEVLPQKIVYEKLFNKSLPQQMRDSYFLTELYNVKTLIKRTEETQGASTELGKSQTAQSSTLAECMEPYYQPTSSGDCTLVFESRFESGNLCMAIKVSKWEYDLLMQNDVNTEGYTQWFYFQVSNTTAKSSVKFNIINFVSAQLTA